MYDIENEHFWTKMENGEFHSRFLPKELIKDIEKIQNQSSIKKDSKHIGMMSIFSLKVSNHIIISIRKHG